MPSWSSTLVAGWGKFRRGDTSDGPRQACLGRASANNSAGLISVLESRTHELPTANCIVDIEPKCRIVDVEGGGLSTQDQARGEWWRECGKGSSPPRHHLVRAAGRVLFGAQTGSWWCLVRG